MKMELLQTKNIRRMPGNKKSIMRLIRDGRKIFVKICKTTSFRIISLMSLTSFHLILLLRIAIFFRVGKMIKDQAISMSDSLNKSFTKLSKTDPKSRSISPARLEACRVQISSYQSWHHLSSRNLIEERKPLNIKFK